MSRHLNPATHNKKGEENQAGHADCTYREEKNHLQDDGSLCMLAAETEAT
ncbi:hypothetical protein E2C01_056491 [Portunus trituberculatus]|uniref:Uncharacterized protein n=1 Tax=Portunus trituberculatus TaxID=210409 RepID=A0A5B7GXU3_PORTR|nr:hypothetical protein [Portunus trituberculatus]